MDDQRQGSKPEGPRRGTRLGATHESPARVSARRPAPLCVLQHNYFRADPDAFIDLMSSSLNLEARHEGDRHVVLSRRTRP